MLNLLKMVDAFFFPSYFIAWEQLHALNMEQVFSIRSWKSAMPQALFKQHPFISHRERQLIFWNKTRSPESTQAPLFDNRQ